MGVVADLREGIQDFVAPEGKEIGARLEAFAQSRHERMEGLARSQGAIEAGLVQGIVQPEKQLMLTMKVALLSRFVAAR